MIAVLEHARRDDPTAEEVRAAISTARAAQTKWAAQPVRERARRIGRLRPLLAQSATALARSAAAPNERPLGEKMVSEILPLIASCEFLQKNAARILRTKRFGARGRPLWLHGSSFEVVRKPFGVVLIVGPANYPLFIPAVQALHALAAGNAVVLKPAEGATEPLARFLEQVIDRSEIPPNLVQLLPETPEAARAAARAGIDKAIFTGSSANGRDFLAELAQRNIPAVMELSGADPVFVRVDADLELAAKSIAFGLRLNAGNTCMAPHAITAHREIAEELRRLLVQHRITTDTLLTVRDDAEALHLIAMNEHGLGAAVFSRDESAARAFAGQLTTGFVTINDLIVPTADPRFPFGGVRGSGFGVTRGAEGLLEMTFPQAIAFRRTRFRPHLDEPRPGDEHFFAAYVAGTHSRGIAARLRSFRKLFSLGRKRLRDGEKSP